jgi:hypothetical protein
MSTQWDPISFNSGYYKTCCLGSFKLKTQLSYDKVHQEDVKITYVLKSIAPLYVH